MISSVRFCLSYNLLNVILLPSNFVYFNENLGCYNGFYLSYDTSITCFCCENFKILLYIHKVVIYVILLTFSEVFHTNKPNKCAKSLNFPLYM